MQRIRNKTTHAYFGTARGQIVWMNLVQELVEEVAFGTLRWPKGSRSPCNHDPRNLFWRPAIPGILERRDELERAALKDFGPCFEDPTKPLPYLKREEALKELHKKILAYCAEGPQPEKI